VLIDFGLSRLRDQARLTADGTCVGSPSYLAPERLLEEEVDGRADLYSLGVTMYELIAGRTPFRADSPLEVARQHLLEPPPRLDRLRPAISPGLAAVIHHALAKEPAARFGSAEEVLAALDELPVTTSQDSLVTEIAPEWVQVLPSSDSLA
jgi:serine/threonine-protein kinase